MLFSNMASATPINGKVADAVTGEAIIGASVIYNNKVGAVTDVEGRFHLDIASFPSDISVNYVGYESLRVKIGERDSVVSIRLHEDAQTLNEVVVVGYGTQKRTQLTGSVTTISKDVLNFLTLSLMSGIGAPIAILGIILPIYTIIDMIETAENVWSDSCVSAMVDRDLHLKKGSHSHVSH